MNPSRVSDIKRAQKESVLLRLISGLFHQITLEKPALRDIYVTRVELSPGKTLCRVFFYTTAGAEHFRSVLDEIKLYKPSMRKAVAQTFNARYTVDLLFVFDEQFEKTQRIESLIEKVKQKDAPYHHSDDTNDNHNNDDNDDQ